MYEANEDLGEPMPSESSLPATLDDDKPPAGTACEACKAGGHFCPAKRWHPASGIALCVPCTEERDCDTFRAACALHKNPFGPIGSEEDSSNISGMMRMIPRSEWKEKDLAIHEQPVRREDVPYGLRKELAPAKIDSPKKEVKLVDTALAKQGSILPPNPRIGDAKDMVDALGNILAGVANGTIKPDQANAACNIAMAMLKCVELDHKINGSK